MNLLPQDTSPRAVVKLIPAPLRGAADVVLRHMQHGTFQRSLALMVAGSSAVSAMEVGYEHYRGSYSNPVMYTPVLLSGALPLSYQGVPRRHGCATYPSSRLRTAWLGSAFTSAASLASRADGACPW